MAKSLLYTPYSDLVKSWGEPHSSRSQGLTYYIVWKGVSINGEDKTLMFKSDFLGTVEYPSMFEGVECDSHPNGDSSVDAGNAESRIKGIAVDSTSNINVANSKVDTTSTSHPQESTPITKADSVPLISLDFEGGKGSYQFTKKLPQSYCSGELKFTFFREDSVVRVKCFQGNEWYNTYRCNVANNLIEIDGGDGFFASNDGVLTIVYPKEHISYVLKMCK